MDSIDHSFLFIPDISGFTEFVHHTDVEHSQHIISELLESIIDSNVLDLEVSEVEGDAVLFFKRDQVPSLEQVLEQSRKMFINFHLILRKYEKQRICNCGACSTAVNLKLKFVAHSGQLGFIKVKEFEKPHGYEVILVHKLLKNEVEDPEYLLWTQSYKCNDSSQSLTKLGDWIELREGFTDYEKLGRVEYRYIPLQALHNQVSEPEIDIVDRSKNPIRQKVFVKREPHLLFQYLIRLDLRYQWNKGLKDITYDDKINRIGSKHICLLDSGTLEIETVSDGRRSQDTLIYGENILNPPFPFKSLSTFFNIRPEQGGSSVELEIDFSLGPIFKWLNPIFRRVVGKKLGKSLIWLKEGSERFEDNFASEPHFGRVLVQIVPPE